MPMLPGSVWTGVKFESASTKPGISETIFTWDSNGAILCMDATSGTVRWQSIGLGRVEKVVDVFSAMIEGHAYTIVFGVVDCVVLDGKTGEIVGNSRYTEMPKTVASMYGSKCIYGSTTRKLVWARFESERIPSRTQPKIAPGIIDHIDEIKDVGSRIVLRQIRAMQVTGSFQSAPVSGESETLIVTTSRGEVACVHKDSGAILWRTTLGAGIVATPSVSQTTVYVGSKDQYLRAVELTTGRTLWKWFAPAELILPSLLAEELILIQVPGSGLAALRAKALNKPDGELLWICESVRGNPINRTKEGVICWDASTATLSLVDDHSGKVRASVVVSNVAQLSSTLVVNGDLMVLANDGGLQRYRVASRLPVTTAATDVVAKKAEATVAGTGDEQTKDNSDASTTTDASKKPDA